MDVAPSLSQVIAQSRGLDPSARKVWIEAAMEVEILEQQAKLLESSSLLFGLGGTSRRVVTEDPRFDDGEFWDETGFAGGRGMLRPLDEGDLTLARGIARELYTENGYAKGFHKARQSYIVGTGIELHAVPKKTANPPLALTERINDRLKAFRKLNRWSQLSPELVRRKDRDGEYILRSFLNATGPLRWRAMAPQAITQPITTDGRDVLMGVEVAPGDTREMVALYITEALGVAPVRVTRAHVSQAGFTHFILKFIPQLIHEKANVDLDQRRGWPTLWAARRNLWRANKLLRNSGNVAALQSSIALIREHTTASRDQIRSFVSKNAAALLTNQTTGRETFIQDVPPFGTGGGQIIDHGPGVKYHAPINTVNAGNNVAIIQAELREAAASVQMPEFMFTSDASNSNFASTLVAESPWIKALQTDQADHLSIEEELHWAAIYHDIAWGRLPMNVPDLYNLEGEPPSLVVRNQGEETQRNATLNQARVLSPQSWAGREGLNHDDEQANFQDSPVPATSTIPNLTRPVPGDRTMRGSTRPLRGTNARSAG